MPRSRLASRPTIAAVAGIGVSLAGLAVAAPSVAVGGLLLAMVGLVLRPRATPASRVDEPTWFTADSTDFVRSVAAPAFASHRGQRPRAPRWCRQVFQDIEWQRLESVCTRLHLQLGLEPRLPLRDARGDIDLEALRVEELLAMVTRLTPAQQEALLAHAYEDEYWRPTCVRCGLKMVERPDHQGDAGVWSCAAAPRCAFTLPLRTA